jgi:hypothetical protein
MLARFCRSLTHLLLWLGGADPDVIARCNQLPRGERQRLAALGGTVCIPGLVAFTAWSYATFTFTGSRPISVAVGLVGVAIVMWLDRLLLMTMHKSSLDSRAAFLGGLLTRLAFSIILNYGLAEPAMLFLFRGPIAQQLIDDRRAREEAVFDKAASLRTNSWSRLNQERADATHDLSLQLDQKNIQLGCINALVTLETAGGVPAGTPVKGRDGAVCGFVTGKEGCKEQCRMDEATGTQLLADVRRLQEQIRNRLDGIDGNGVTAAIHEGDRIRGDVLAEVPSTDYASRRRLLGEVEARNTVIRHAHWFLVLALIALDSLALIIKALMPPGEYEEQRDTALALARAAARSERAAGVDWLTTAGYALHPARLVQEANKRQIEALARCVRDFLEVQSREFQLFHDQLRVLESKIAQIRSEEARRACMEFVADLHRTFTQASGKALEKLRAEIGTM